MKPLLSKLIAAEIPELFEGVMDINLPQVG